MEVIQVQVKNLKKSYAYGLLSALCYGVGNYFMSDLSHRVGMLSLFAQTPAMFLPFLLYHAYHFRKHSCKLKSYFKDSHLHLPSLLYPLSRVLILLLVHSSCYSTYYFASLANINGGIITALFSTSSIFTCVIYYFKYGQKITIRDYLGTTILLVSVTLIAVGKNHEE